MIDASHPRRQRPPRTPGAIYRIFTALIPCLIQFVVMAAAAWSDGSESVPISIAVVLFPCSYTSQIFSK